MFSEYCKQRVCECPSDAFGDVKKSEKKFILKVDEHLRKLTVNELLKLKYEISQLLKLNLRLLHVDDGCIQLTFRVLESDSIVINEDQQKALQVIGVLKVEYGNEIIDLSTSSLKRKILGKF